METHHDRLIRVEGRLPGFGGMFIDSDGLLAVYLLDPAKIAEARPAIESVFGASYVPAKGLRALRGRYTVSRLKGWFERATGLLELAGVTAVSLDESRNRVSIALDGAGRKEAVVRALQSRGIPLDAVIVEVKGPIRQLDRV
jgi:hypothetical protein